MVTVLLAKKKRKPLVVTVLAHALHSTPAANLLADWLIGFLTLSFSLPMAFDEKQPCNSNAGTRTHTHTYTPTRTQSHTTAGLRLTHAGAIKTNIRRDLIGIDKNRDDTNRDPILVTP